MSGGSYTAGLGDRRPHSPACSTEFDPPDWPLALCCGPRERDRAGGGRGTLPRAMFRPSSPRRAERCAVLLVLDGQSSGSGVPRLHRLHGSFFPIVSSSNKSNHSGAKLEAGPTRRDPAPGVRLLNHFGSRFRVIQMDVLGEQKSPPNPCLEWDEK